MAAVAKQAIDRFRGGDIHAYQRAVVETDRGSRLTLGVNHCSSPALVTTSGRSQDESYQNTVIPGDAQRRPGIHGLAVAPEQASTVFRAGWIPTSRE